MERDSDSSIYKSKEMTAKKYDVFISHASEDRDAIVRPLAIMLERLSVKVWFDEFSLQVGDSLSASIDKGLKESRYGLLVLSKSFLGKNWPDYEYRSLLTRQIDGEKVILPLWYDVDQNDVKDYSLFLADIKGLPITRDSLNQAVLAVVKAVRPDIWQEIRMRGVLRKMVEEGEYKVVKRSEIKMATEKQSKLTPQQLVRSKAVYYGIGRHLNKSFEKYVDDYELDVVPERELQSWEIMNACYLEMLDNHKNATESEIEDYFKVLVVISMGLEKLPDIRLSAKDITELIALWKENYYEF